MDPHLRTEYSTELVAAIAIRFLPKNRKGSDARSFAEVARRACAFLDACRDAAEAHRRASYGLLDQPVLGKRVQFDKVLRQIGKRRHSLNKTRELYREFVRDKLSAPTNLTTLSRKELRDAVTAEIAKQQAEGVYEGHLESVRSEFLQWQKARTLAAKRAAGAKGGRISALKKL